MTYHAIDKATVYDLVVGCVAEYIKGDFKLDRNMNRYVSYIDGGFLLRMRTTHVDSMKISLYCISEGRMAGWNNLFARRNGIMYTFEWMGECEFSPSTGYMMTNATYSSALLADTVPYIRLALGLAHI